MRNRSTAGRTGTAARTTRVTACSPGAWGGFLFRGALVGLLSLLAMQQAWAWARPMPNWASLVDDAEVIAAGHIVGTPIYVAHKRPPDEGRSWEFRARLAIDEVLKGKCPDKEISVILQYGLSPSEYTQDGKPVQQKWLGDRPGLTIHDTGETFDGRPILTDARAPAVWLLSHYPDRFARKGGPTEDFSVRDPEHMQPIGMLPFFRSILKPEPIAMQLAFLHDPAPENRLKVLQYFIARRETTAFPAVADLLTDPDTYVRRLAIEGCVPLGGTAAIPHLRSVLDTGDRGAFWATAHALAQLHDVGSVPRLTQVLAADSRPPWRAAAAGALGSIGDPAVIPSLINALNDDGCYDSDHGTEVWRDAQDGLQALTRCRLSPNGDKAARWWTMAQGLAPIVWEHFRIADTIASLYLLGPDGLERAQGTLFARFPDCRSDSLIYAARFDYRTYNPRLVREYWRQWLVGQGWDDYRPLPAQADDELAVKIEFTAALKSTEPVHLRYTLTNKSGADVWLTRQHYELLDVQGVSGGGYFTPEGKYNRPRASSTGDFVCLRAGEQRTIVGKAILWNDPHNRQSYPPRLVAAALCFDQKGTSCALKAWVGEVWAEPIVVPGTAAPGRSSSWASSGTFASAAFCWSQKASKSSGGLAVGSIFSGSKAAPPRPYTVLPSAVNVTVHRSTPGSLSVPKTVVGSSPRFRVPASTLVAPSTLSV